MIDACKKAVPRFRDVLIPRFEKRITRSFDTAVDFRVMNNASLKGVKIDS